MADDGMTARDAKLIQYLNEAYGKEKELETSLTAHIQMTTRKPYRRRLEEHLRETRSHARQVERRIKQLGGKAEAVPAPGPDAVAEAASTVQSVASRAVAAAKGPLHMIRGTGENEKMLKNAKTEYSNEFEEIGTYRSIQTLAETVGDKDTVQLAKAIAREEERMAKFLERLIPQLTKGVAKEEIPAVERRTGGGRRRRTSRRASTSARGRSASGRSKSASSRGRSTSGRAKSTSSRGRSTSARGKSASSRGRSTSARSKSASSRGRSSASRSGGRSSGGRSSSRRRSS
jgi:ferritin-like metal-binding protein YciE